MPLHNSIKHRMIAIRYMLPQIALGPNLAAERLFTY